MKRSIWIGFDKRESAAFAVACHSVQRHLITANIPVKGLVDRQLRADKLLRRPTKQRNVNGNWVTWDVISDAPQSTDHANSRFLVPELAGSGWALFMDGDMLALSDLTEVFDGLDPNKAVYCVKHRHVPAYNTKMDGQIQTTYHRKNWSSFVIFNVDHPANKRLTNETVNSIPGRDLHRFCWLDDDLIGELGQEWNHLVGLTEPKRTPKVVHFTDGTPDMPGYENCDFADDWRRELSLWACR